MKQPIEKKFLAAYDAHADAIFRHCMIRVYSKDKAEDLVQETFVRVWRYLEKGEEVENIRAFLYKVANNLIIDQSRKKKEERLEEMIEAQRIKEPSHPGHKAIEAQTLLGQVFESMEGLPEEQKQLLTMRFVDDLDPKEIAEVMGITANNVSVKINRAVAALKARFEPGTTR